MSWLSEQITSLQEPGPPELFLKQVEELVATIGAKPGVTAVFAAHEGLLVATHGSGDFEALAATAQLAMALTMPGEGAPAQVVLVGAHQKIAVLRWGRFF